MDLFIFKKYLDLLYMSSVQSLSQQEKQKRIDQEKQEKQKKLQKEVAHTREVLAEHAKKYKNDIHDTTRGGD